MLSIHYPTNLNSAPLRWKARLDELVVGHELIPEESLSQPLLKLGSDRVAGEKEIDDYLEELVVFMAQWRECRCDKWEFD